MNRPVIRVLPFDLARALDGATMCVTDEQGTEYDLRLFTAEEFMTVQHAAVDKIRPGDDDAKIDIDRARDLTGNRKRVPS